LHSPVRETPPEGNDGVDRRLAIVGRVPVPGGKPADQRPDEPLRVPSGIRHKPLPQNSRQTHHEFRSPSALTLWETRARRCWELCLRMWGIKVGSKPRSPASSARLPLVVQPGQGQAQVPPPGDTHAAVVCSLRLSLHPPVRVHSLVVDLLPNSSKLQLGHCTRPPKQRASHLPSSHMHLPTDPEGAGRI